MTKVLGTPVATATTPGTMNVPLPAGAGAGHVVFLSAVAKMASTDTFTDPTGWTPINVDRTSTILSWGLWYRVLDGGANDTITLGTIATNDPNMAFTWWDDEVDAADVIDAVGIPANSSTGSGALTLPGITVTAGARVYAVYWGFDNSATGGATGYSKTAFTEPATFTELADADSDTGSDISAGLAFLDGASGPTGDQAMTGTPNSTANYRIAGLLFSTNLDAGGTPIDVDIIAATETDTALALSIGAALSLAAATETDAAQALTFSIPQHYTITAATETSSPAAILANATISVATTTEAAQTLVVTKPIHATLVAATETATAQSLDYSQATSYDITAAAETDAAQTVAFTKTIFKTLAAATETTSARTLSVSQAGSHTIPAASTTDVAQPLAITKTIFKALTPATGTSVAVALSAAATQTVGAAATTDAAVALTFTRHVALLPALSTSTAQPLGITHVIYRTLTPATTLDVAYALEGSLDELDPIAAGDLTQPVTGRIARPRVGRI